MVRPFNSYPYQNLNDLNLDYLLEVADKAREVLEDLGNYDARIDELEKCCNAVRSGNFTPEMVEKIKEIIQNDIIDLVGEMVKFVFFGLTDTGYFVAYIPEPWDSIIFNTTEYDLFIPDVTKEFGRLVLSY